MAATGRILKTGLTDLYDLRIKRAWIQGYGEPEHEFEQIYKVEELDTEDVRGSYVSGFGQWPRKTIGANVTADSIYQGYDVTITPATYAMYFTIEEETVEDERAIHGLLGEKLATALAQSGRETVETLAANGLNGSNLTSTSGFSPWFSGGDGSALLATTHPILSGGTYANTPASQADFSVATLQASRTRLEKMQGARGQRWPMQAKTVVLPVDSRWLASQILGSEKLPFTADNTPNPVREGITPVFWSRLSDTNQWLTLAAKEGETGGKGHSLVCAMRIRPEFARDNEFLSGDRRYKGRVRVGFGYWDFRGVDGSTGSS